MVKVCPFLREIIKVNLQLLKYNLHQEFLKVLLLLVRLLPFLGAVCSGIFHSSIAIISVRTLKRYRLKLNELIGVV